MSICDQTGTYTYDNNVIVLWVTSIANVQIPTASQLVTGTTLNDTYCLTDIMGWEIETDTIDDGIWGPFEEQRMGRQSIADSRFLFAAHRDGADIRTLLTRGETGNIVILPSGPYLQHLTAPVNVYPVRVSQLTQRQRLRTGGGSIIEVTFVITARCGENVTVAP